ncbi:MAG: SDR family NAD(P)-dependent oxidoreductase [Anaerolineales bacterium]
MSPDTRLDQLISLNGKTAIITGAAAGMGAATARRFAEAGAELILLDINKEGLEQVKDELGKFASSVITYKVDVGEKEEIDTFWTSLNEEVPEVLINNAGIFPFKEFLETEESFVDHLMGVNLFSAYWMCQHFIERLLKRKKGGVIVNVSSIEAMIPFKDDLAHYSISKAGVAALTRSLSRDFGRKGIRVNAVLPGGIKTEGVKDAYKEVFKDPGLLKDGYHFSSRLSLGRMGDPDEIARMILVLASEMSSYMNGALVPVDGGFLSS